MHLCVCIWLCTCVSVCDYEPICLYVAMHLRVCMYYEPMSLYVGMYSMSTGAHGDQKRTSGPLELELQVFVSNPTWILGSDL